MDLPMERSELGNELPGKGLEGLILHWPSGRWDDLT